ncbi:MAG: discoidin domain-containing protein [Streptococcaceae bacterium]|jgi:hypothetical protein|nr:discoidin domain-containing protein [Streptococcaceae bacterium]
MITVRLLNEQKETINEHHHLKEAYLAYKNRSYNEGEIIQIESDKKDTFIWVQVDSSLCPSLIYMKNKIFEFPILFDHQMKQAYPPSLFTGEDHYIRAFTASDEEIYAYRNLSLNPHDQKHETGAYPHAYANVETRNDSTFFARNAIDGIIANENHGPYPYQSWGINQQKDAQITIDFGREVEVDKLAIVLRGDYPHDSYWKQATIEFSDETTHLIELTNALDRQYFSFTPKKTSRITMKNLIKHEDESPFPALTQLEVYGKEMKDTLN